MATDTKENVKNVTEEPDYTEEGAKSDEGQKETPPKESDLATNRLLATMVSDPDIQAVLAARRTGRSVKVVDEPLEPTEEPKEDEVITDESLEGFDDDIKKVVGLLGKQIDSKLTPITDKLTALEHIAQGYEKQAVDNQIGVASKKHPDFDKYRSQMAELARGAGSGLAVEELYLLSKHRAGDLKTVLESTHSEQPTPTPRRKGVGSTLKENSKPSRRGFQARLADALDNLDDIPR